VSAFPACRTVSLIEAFSGCYQLEAAQNIFETTLNHPNVDSHLAGMILNAGLIENSDREFHFYRDGLVPSVLRIMEAQYREKVTVMEALGLEVRTRIELLHLIANEEDSRFDTFRALPGPQSMDHRFLTEDAFAVMSFLVSLGAQLGIDVPVARSLLRLASVIGQEEYLENGRTLENLGLGGFGGEKMIAYLETGGRER
jgi:opine dehydrogenase